MSTYSSPFVVEGRGHHGRKGVVHRGIKHHVHGSLKCSYRSALLNPKEDQMPLAQFVFPVIPQ